MITQLCIGCAGWYTDLAKHFKNICSSKLRNGELTVAALEHREYLKILFKADEAHEFQKLRDDRATRRALYEDGEL